MAADQYDVLISHRSDDKPWVEALARNLKWAGLRVFLDSWELVPNKHVREAVKFADENGWRFEKSSARAHIFGKLLCPHAARDGCRMNVFSTPSDPEEHAQRIIHLAEGKLPAA